MSGYIPNFVKQAISKLQGGNQIVLNQSSLRFIFINAKNREK